MVAALAVAACGRATEDEPDRADPEPVLEEASRPSSAAESRGRRAHPRAVQLEGAGAQPEVEGDPLADAPSPGAQTDAEVRAELRQARAALADFKQHLSTTAFLQTGPRARVLPDGTAVAPENAPGVVKRVILAGNEIAKFPYKWGGGHGAWRDTGYDCSGLGVVRTRRRGDARLAADLGRLPRVGHAGAGRVDHDLHQPRPHLHGRRRPALRHQRPRPRRHALAGGAAQHERLRRPPLPGV